ncbi:MAG: 2,3,4,5-tetrahydropyridine-2,6-dicarboxylate N-acetyltransferase [Fusobacteriaceae bacterium]
MSDIINHGQEIIKFIRDAKKVTPVKVYVSGENLSVLKLQEDGVKVFGDSHFKILIGELSIIEKFIEENKSKILDYYIENDRRNSAIPLLDKTHINARIEPGAIIRDMVEIGENAVIMMGAIINIGAKVGKKTMIDMGVVLGGRAVVGDNCHIGAGTVLAGVVEPPSAMPVIVEDDVVIGANAVVIEGVRIGKGSVVAAGAIVLHDVPAGVVVAGNPAKIIKNKDSKTESKTEIIEDLRKI